MDNTQVIEQASQGNSRKQYWYVIRELTGREIKRKYARSYLGIIWSVLNPLLTMIVLSAIFSTMFKRSIENYPVYYLTGWIIWQLFSEATRSSLTVLVDNKNLLIKTKIPRIVFVLSRCYTALVNFAFSCIAYVFIIAIFQLTPDITWLLFFVDMAFILILSIGMGALLSILYVFFADVKHLYGVFLTMLMYLSAIFYPVDSLPGWMQSVLGVNPIYIFIDFARSAIMEYEVPDPIIWIKMIVWSIVVFAIGITVFRRRQNDVMIHI
ncbi:ABC transporter permease [Eubacterium oxidoreducens]|uniref:Transport permease protein n=1 Tax=Eubacterium oxidoreducens TaxID=1732 RepID=A0A1G6CBB6_EUBOX|nr:ABC transporter permease [Eubacterium oxidoreducens]SDB30153.1 ABC-2 type transport system permease protein [Eubacterium oxidoreducens]